MNLSMLQYFLIIGSKPPIRRNTGNTTCFCRYAFSKPPIRRNTWFLGRFYHSDFSKPPIRRNTAKNFLHFPQTKIFGLFYPNSEHLARPLFYKVLQDTQNFGVKCQFLYTFTLPIVFSTLDKNPLFIRQKPHTTCCRVRFFLSAPYKIAVFHHLPLLIGRKCMV